MKYFVDKVKPFLAFLLCLLCMNSAIGLYRGEYSIEDCKEKLDLNDEHEVDIISVSKTYSLFGSRISAKFLVNNNLKSVTIFRESHFFPDKISITN